MSICLLKKISTTPNIFLIDFIADASTEMIHVLNNSTAAGSSISIDSFGVLEENGTNTLLAMMINTNNENRYRFGSGKQEMDNEIAGFGNMNTALFWEYDTRLGRRWNLDPKPNVNMSQYSAFSNNPLLFTDLKGDSVIYALDKNGANGQGHMSTLIQDKDGQWYFFSQYAKSGFSALKLFTNQDVDGGIDLIAFPKVTTTTTSVVNGKTVNTITTRNMNGAEAIAYLKKLSTYSADETSTLNTTISEDATIYQNALNKKKAFDDNKEKYKLLSNNCVDGGQKITETNTGIELPNDYRPSPNGYFPKLKKGVDEINSRRTYKIPTRSLTPADNTSVKTPLKPIKR